MGIHCLDLSLARSLEECSRIISLQNIQNKMLKFVVASCFIAAAAGQYVDPKNAKILKEQRFNAGDGRFGSAYAQEDGVVFREETGAGGERVGQYSYIDNDGKTITVRYSAGKDGFKILEGAHVPEGATGLNSAPYNPEQAAAAPVQQQQQFQQQPAAPVRQQAAAVDYDYVDAPVDPNFNPFISPNASSLLNPSSLLSTPSSSNSNLPPLPPGGPSPPGSSSSTGSRPDSTLTSPPSKACSLNPYSFCCTLGSPCLRWQAGDSVVNVWCACMAVSVDSRTEKSYSIAHKLPI